VIQLDRREKIAVLAAAGVTALFLLLQFVVFPAQDRKKVLQRQRVAQRQALEEIQSLRVEYERLQRQAARARSKIAAKKQDFSLFSFLDRTADATGVKDYIVYMKPSETAQKETGYRISSVEMKMEAISLDRLTRYLYAVETSPNMVDIRRLSITQTGKTEKFLDAVLEIQTYFVNS
jgi:general secretion pathway protein M